MVFDIELIRELLRKFGFEHASGILGTDGFQLSPPSGFELSDRTSAHVDALVSAGLLLSIREIHSEFADDTPTLRATETGREWVRRSYDDLAWEASRAEPEGVLTRAIEL